jgi:hypothetical protein
MDFEKKLEAEIQIARQAGIDASGVWELFEAATPEQQRVVFNRALESGVLDDEYAFELLTSIRGNLDQRSPEERAIYAGLLDRMQELASKLFQASSHYYHRDLINFAIIEGRWDELPDLLAPYTSGQDLDTFAMVIDQLKYHGQIRHLIATMQAAWPKIKESTQYIDWAIDEYAGTLMELMLVDYLEKTDDPHPDDPVLLESTASLLQWKEGWLDWFIPTISRPDRTKWSIADFSEDIGSETWRRKFSTLQIEFIASQWRAGVPLTRGLMAFHKWSEIFYAQIEADKKSKKRMKKGKKAGVSHPSQLLMPNPKRMDKILGESFSIVGGKPYDVAAALELIPAYVKYLEGFGIIQPSERQQAIGQIGPLVAQMPDIMAYYGCDPVAVDTLLATWEQ